MLGHTLLLFKWNEQHRFYYYDSLILFDSFIVYSASSTYPDARLRSRYSITSGRGRHKLLCLLREHARPRFQCLLVLKLDTSERTNVHGGSRLFNPKSLLQMAPFRRSKQIKCYKYPEHCRNDPEKALCK